MVKLILEQLRNGDDDEELVYGGPADNINSCENAECTECVEAWYESDPTNVQYMCMDRTRFKYTYKCGNKKDQSKCGSEDYCHWSYPEGDPRKKRSEEATCRPIPQKLIDGPFKFARRAARRSNWGLCKYGCGGYECRNSYLLDDPLRWKGYS